MKSKAMVVVEPGKMDLKEFEVVPPRKDEMLVKLKTTSVCASDPKIMWGHTPYVAFPIVMGHELTGEVAEIGEEAARNYRLKEGDRISVEPMVPCGHCKWCRTEHHYHKCRPMRVYGLTLTADHSPYLFGGYSEFMYVLPGSLVHKVAEGVSDLAASLSSVIGNGVRWIKTLGEMTYGQTLVISGAGSQGLATLLAAKECGVGPIVMLGLERDQARFDLAKEFGVDFTLNIEKQNPLEEVPKLLEGPPDTVIETSGVPSAIQAALEIVKPVGKVVSIGLSGGKETAVKFDMLVAKGVTVLADHAQAGNVEDAMRLINSRKYAIEKINNFKYHLEQLPKALEDTAHPPEGFIKGAVVFA